MELLNFNGDSRRLSEWGGKVLLLNFWATWCEPCCAEVPLLIDLQRRYGARQLQIVGITIDEADKVKAYGAALAMNYPTLLRREQALALMAHYG